MTTGFINIHGQPIERFASHPTTIKPRKEAPAEYHKGWVVEGHAPGSMEKAKEEAEKVLRAWETKPEGKQPKPWNETFWRMNGKLQRVRQKPFEINSAAQEMKALAEKAGWQDVRVTELAKRK